MRTPLSHILSALLVTLAAATGAMAGETGIFEGSSDVGPVKTPGSIDYDSARQVYRLTGSGTNMWFGADEFFFVWKKMSGDFILSADAGFPNPGGDPHRKLGWIIRDGLEPGARYIDVALHGDGLAAIRRSSCRPSLHRMSCSWNATADVTSCRSPGAAIR